MDCFRLPVRVYIEDTDATGVVFYANYLRYMERARTELVRSLGFPKVMLLEEGICYVVHSLNVQYHKPALLDDELEVTARVDELGRSFMVFQQQVRRDRDDQVLVSATVKVACVDARTLRPRRLPPMLMDAIRKML